ncbi:MAG: hypothetical protein BGN97_12625 [Microbacterium sp. 69-10]|uniref:glycosyl hydrolase 2 galactose-binding domain-containing protein n=1 Tax=Microbacterium sp. 69-10 TaxID=1895783 RepID=UPI000962BF24|nr:glycoside hydrolase family 2 TIM barrel-domain containing protein [Microbacterium sp. 69-10]OJU39007.1 MAG: hypothetical protein BGN97_12625 [Microbacterium sp. 69-10]
MTSRFDLTSLEWTLRGWRVNDWELEAGFARLEAGRPDVAAVPVHAPGSVRGALLAAGIVPDPAVGLRSRESEWIENRHWTYTAFLADDQIGPPADGGRIVLVADSLDYCGVVLLGQVRVGEFTGAMTPHEFDLTEAWTSGERMLTIVFTGVPADLGQIGWTSRIREFKARYNYGWDWTPRIVQIGVAGPLTLEHRCGARLVDLDVRATLLEEGAGTVAVRARIEGDATHAVVTVTGPDGDAVSTTMEVASTLALTIDLHAVAPWELGAGTLYRVEVDLVAGDGTVSDHALRRVGFRTVRWLPIPGAPEDAEPWLLEINGRTVFMAGVNWVPIRPDSADVTETDYRIRLDEYRRMSVNTLRVWGGAAREQHLFYDLADEYGFAVWQELPLSSSGLDNLPPEDDAFAAEFASIAQSYARQLAHHPSIVLWGGGNELIDERGGSPVPLTADHPTLAAARTALADADPERRFVATSPTGPSVWGDPDRRGLGLHHDVHGPWESDGTFEEWKAYWDGDDALLRSEVGMGGASPLAMLEDRGLLLPVDTDEQRRELTQLWSHSSAWWLGPFKSWDGEGGLAAWVDQSQRRQAEWLAYAARATRARFPACAGFVVWLGHDTFPCAVSLSLLDADGAPKPVAEALGRVFRGEG